MSRRTSKRKWYVVQKVYPWSAITIQGQPLSDPQDKDQPVRFMPVFSSLRAAKKWAADGVPIAKVEELSRVPDA